MLFCNIIKPSTSLKYVYLYNMTLYVSPYYIESHVYGYYCYTRSSIRINVKFIPNPGPCNLLLVHCNLVTFFNQNSRYRRTRGLSKEQGAPDFLFSYWTFFECSCSLCITFVDFIRSSSTRHIFVFNDELANL